MFFDKETIGAGRIARGEITIELADWELFQLIPSARFSHANRYLPKASRAERI